MPTRSRKRFLWCALVLFAALASAGGWWAARPAPQGARSLVLLVSGDTAGWIVPCGCTSNQSGGLLRRGTHVRRLREKAEVLAADVGGAPGGTSPYHRLKFEAILRGELALGLVAHNLGGPEAALGADYLRDAAQRLNLPFISANLRDKAGALVTSSLRIVEAGGQRIAFAGVLSRRYAAPGIQIDDPREALLKVVGDARGRYEALVVLAYLPEEELRQLASALPEADAVVGGPTGQSIPPQVLGPTLLAAATNKGKFLVELTAAVPGSRPAWTGRVVEMGPDLADDAEQQTNLRYYLEELGQRDFRATETGLAESLPPGLPKDYRLAGSASCLPCHQGACNSWQGTAHVHAWDTLTVRGAQVDAFCQQCHTTGYGLPGGFESVARSPQARGVGCESCHGPSLSHTRTPQVATPLRARDQCVRCHDAENSPRFEYARYWPRIRHGLTDDESPRPRQPSSRPEEVRP
jgi:hypothetical protein